MKVGDDEAAVSCLRGLEAALFAGVPGGAVRAAGPAVIVPQHGGDGVVPVTQGLSHFF